MSDTDSEKMTELEIQDLCKRFKTGLLEQGIVYDDTFKQNFIFVNNDQVFLDKYLDDNYGQERFYKQFSNRRLPVGKGLPKHKETCICKTHIKSNCYIYNRETQKLLIIGKCCAKKFIDNTLFKYKCIKCNIVKRKTKNSYCNNCKDNYKKCSSNNCSKIIDKRYVYCFNCNQKYKTIHNLCKDI